MSHSHVILNDCLKAPSQANGVFLFHFFYIFLNVWMSESNIPMDYNF